LSKTFLILRRIQRDITTNTLTSSRKLPVILVRILGFLKFHDRFSKNTQIRNFIKTRRVGVDLFYDDGQREMTRLIVAFLNFTKASEKMKKIEALSKKKVLIW
jgi:hypothetical protein